MSSLLLIIASFFYPVSTPADGFLCYGKGFAYTTSAPKGWVLDNVSGQADGLCIVGYPKGGSWAKSESVMYLNATTKGESKGSRSLADMIDHDIEQHKTRNPEVKIEDGEKFTNGKRKLASKYFFNERKEGGYEAVVYIDEPKAGVFAVMSSRTMAGFKKSLPALRAFVKNYHLVTSDVEIKIGK